MNLVKTISIPIESEVAEFVQKKENFSQYVVNLIRKDMNVSTDTEELHATEDIVSAGKLAEFKMWQSIHTSKGLTTSGRDYMMHRKQGTKAKRIAEVMAMVVNNDTKVSTEANN
jgi:hypothetical protein